LINLTTGVTYTGSYVSNDIANITFTGAPPLTYGGTLKILLTTSGGGNNGKLLIDYHATLNANGVLTVDLYNYRSGCQ